MMVKKEYKVTFYYDDFWSEKKPCRDIKALFYLKDKPTEEVLNGLLNNKVNPVYLKDNRTFKVKVKKVYTIV